MEKYDDSNEAYKTIETYKALKRSNVATARRQAEIDYEAAQKSMLPDEFSRMNNNGQISLNHFDKSAHYRVRMKENYPEKRQDQQTGAERA